MQLSLNFPIPTPEVKKEVKVQQKNDDHDSLMRQFLQSLNCKTASEAIDKIGYPVAFRQAFKKWREARK